MKIDAIITDVITDSAENNRLQPIIVNFQNGQLKDDETNNMKSGLFSDERSGKTVLALSNGKIVYKGYRPNLEKEPMCTMLAIHNKKTGKIKLIQAERWDVAPVLNRNLDTSQYLESDKIATLNRQFGSKKVKRRTELHEKMKISGESVKELLEKTVSNVDVEKAEGSDTEDSLTNTILPPCNREATNVTDVYNINDIVPKAVLKTLYNIDPDAIVLEGKSKYFIETFEELKKLPKPEKRLATLLYIEALSSWIKIPMKDARKRVTNICPHSVEVNDHVVEQYSVTNVNGRLRPNSLKDKGIVHCMILALALNDYSLDLELFATEIGNRISLKKLTEFSRLIGAVSQKDSKKVVVLKLPLPSQVTALSKRKYRK